MKYFGEVMRGDATLVEIETWPSHDNHIWISRTTGDTAAEVRITKDEAREIARHLNAAADALTPQEGSTP